MSADRFSSCAIFLKDSGRVAKDKAERARELVLLQNGWKTFWGFLKNESFEGLVVQTRDGTGLIYVPLLVS